MIALCVDDEYLLLQQLERTVSASKYIEKTVGFDDEEEALAWARENVPDIAFLDIRLHGMTGLELASALRALHPKCKIVFCTGYGEYALEAFRLHADGYLVKPLDPTEVQEEIRRLAPAADSGSALLTAKVYGVFTVYDREGKPLEFRRSKARELLAVLVDRGGDLIAPWDIADILWRGESSRWSRNRQDYLYKIIYELRRVLREAGADAVLQKLPDGFVLQMSLLNIDESDRGVQPYMNGYDWACERH